MPLQSRVCHVDEWNGNGEWIIITANQPSLSLYDRHLTRTGKASTTQISCYQNANKKGFNLLKETGQVELKRHRTAPYNALLSGMQLSHSLEHWTKRETEEKVKNDFTIKYATKVKPPSHNSLEENLLPL